MGRHSLPPPKNSRTGLKMLLAVLALMAFPMLLAEFVLPPGLLYGQGAHDLPQPPMLLRIGVRP